MLRSTLLTLVLATVASAHIVITYPGWRGNNLITNDTFPYGMQWMYPCGGMGMTQNRTYWPTTGGAIAFQPGWFRGHETAFAYINLGLGVDGPGGGPQNMSFNMVPGFQILGPTNNPFPGTICLPQVPLPKNMTVKSGDLATIQIVELAQHGAALFSCVDIEFRDPGDEKLIRVGEDNCFNSTDIGFAQIFTVTTKKSGSDQYVVNSGSESGAISSHHVSWLGWLPIAATSLWVLFGL